MSHRIHGILPPPPPAPHALPHTSCRRSLRSQPQHSSRDTMLSHSTQFSSQTVRGAYFACMLSVDCQHARTMPLPSLPPSAPLSSSPRPPLPPPLFFSHFDGCRRATRSPPQESCTLRAERWRPEHATNAGRHVRARSPAPRLGRQHVSRRGRPTRGPTARPRARPAARPLARPPRRDPRPTTWPMHMRFSAPTSTRPHRHLRRCCPCPTAPASTRHRAHRQWSSQGRAGEARVWVVCGLAWGGRCALCFAVLFVRALLVSREVVLRTHL